MVNHLHMSAAVSVCTYPHANLQEMHGNVQAEVWTDYDHYLFDSLECDRAALSNYQLTQLLLYEINFLIGSFQLRSDS